MFHFLILFLFFITPVPSNRRVSFLTYPGRWPGGAAPVRARYIFFYDRRFHIDFSYFTGYYALIRHLRSWPFDDVPHFIIYVSFRPDYFDFYAYDPPYSSAASAAAFQ